MADKKPIHMIAKDLGIESSKVVKACNEIGIYTKGASKRLDYNEEKKIISYFNNGRNAANEVIDIKINPPNEKVKVKEVKKEFPSKLTNKKYFPNRLIK